MIEWLKQRIETLFKGWSITIGSTFDQKCLHRCDGVVRLYVYQMDHWFGHRVLLSLRLACPFWAATFQVNSFSC